MDNITRIVSKNLLELLFPSFCLGCQKEGTYLCEDCKATLEISEHRYCLCSKNPFRLPLKDPKGTCSSCTRKKLSGLFSALAYQEKALTRKLIAQFKYEPYIKSLSKTFAVTIVEHLILTKSNNNPLWDNGVLISIPMEKSKLKGRGYNQSEVLATELSAILAVPVISNNLVKVKKTDSQTNLSARNRQENVRDAFLVRDARLVKGKKVFLVDDVYTTGSTMEEAARVLREAGAKKVFGITIAREG